jgi:hypothetical protein
MLKIVLTEAGEFGRSEVDYYSKDYVNLPNAPLLPCYDAAYGGEQHAYHLLVKDVSETHVVNWKRTPTLAYGRILAEALAILHAHCWGNDRHCHWPTSKQIDAYLDNTLPGLEPLLRHVQGKIPAEWVTELHQIVAQHPAAMRRRTLQDNHFSFIHGDVNPGNVLSAMMGEAPLYLIDRQPFDWSLTVWLGVFDLAYQMGLWWDTAVRRQLEMDVLHHYHACLMKQGITNYSWAELLTDYKLCLLQQIYVPLNWCTVAEDREKMEWVWLPQLHKVMTAVSDLNCLDLFSGEENSGT